MTRRGLAAFIVVTVLVAVVPSWGASLTQTLEGGDTLAVTCNGLRLDQVRNNARQRTLTCVANPTTTTTRPTTTSTSTTSTASTTLPPTTTAPPSGNFTDGFANLNNWSFAHFAYENNVAVPDPRSSATVVNGQARIEAFDQNYGDAALRSTVKYDLTNGGTVTLDMVDDSGGWPLSGFANVSFSANPDDAKASMADERGDAYSPANIPTDALQVQLRDNCRVPWAPPVVVRYHTSAPNGRTVQRGNCAATPDGHWRLVFTAGHLSIRNGANAEVVGYDVTVPPTGWFILGVHNHASMKYSNPVDTDPSIVGLFDNVVYPSVGGTPPSSTSTSTTTQPPTTTGTTTTTSTTTAPTTTAPSGGGFFESFATDQRSRFDFQLHTSSTGGVPTKITDVFVGEHNTACQGPDTHRDVHGGHVAGTFLDVSASELSWWCAPSGDPAKGHFMTALDTGDIATLSFTPKQTFNNVTQVCWDQNMNNLGEAKWVNVFVVPADDIAAHGGNFSYAASSGLAFGGIDRMPPAGSFDFTWLRGSTFANKWGANGAPTETMNLWASYFPKGMVPEGPLDSAPRFRICLTSGGNMVINRPDGTTDTQAIGTTFPSGAVKVIFQDASYNPTKHEGRVERLTWHWDNIAISAG